MPYKICFLYLIIQTLLPHVFSQTNEQLRANLYAIDPEGNTSLYDGNLTLYDINYTNEVDYNDAVKMSNFGENFALLRANTPLVIERRHSIVTSDTIPFKMWNMRQMTYTLELNLTGLNRPGLMAVLEDSYLNTATGLDLNGITRSTFTITNDAASSAANRFKIVFTSLAPAVTLPITFTDVNAIPGYNTVNVKWKVENEINIIKYQVEKSADGFNFKNVNTVGATFTNSSNKTYSWVDLNPVQGDNYYRISSTSTTGSLKYSNVVMRKMTEKKSSVGIYPNPVAGIGTISLNFNNLTVGTYQVKLISMSGRTVLLKKINHTEGAAIETLRPGSKLDAGIYHLEISTADKVVSSSGLIIQ